MGGEGRNRNDFRCCPSDSAVPQWEIVFENLAPHSTGAWTRASERALLHLLFGGRVHCASTLVAVQLFDWVRLAKSKSYVYIRRWNRLFLIRPTTTPSTAFFFSPILCLCWIHTRTHYTHEEREREWVQCRGVEWSEGERRKAIDDLGWPGWVGWAVAARDRYRPHHASTGLGLPHSLSHLLVRFNICVPTPAHQAQQTAVSSGEKMKSKLLFLINNKQINNKDTSTISLGNNRLN